MGHVLLVTILLAIVGHPALAQREANPARQWQIDGVTRTALVFVPEAAQKPNAAPVPVVFAFHGHGGNSRAVARNYGFQRLWTEAIVVYMQGLPTPGMTDPEGKKPGWQRIKGDQGDRDLKFFDTVLASLKEQYPVDAKRIYAMGHSNGAGFTYLLWAERGERFAAFAPVAGGGRSLQSLTPKPVLHIAGEKDPLVQIENQRRVMETIRRVNGCEAEGREWAKYAVWYSSPKNAPVVTCIHPGNHKFPNFAPALIVRFFQEIGAKGN
ncbi:MAG: hypothetical protein OHK0029_18580 [Armatimonadaceae bacterium]